jgi:hypothetical protein
MNSTKITFACVALFSLAGIAQAQTTSDSNSASYSDSSASSGTSSISGSGNSQNTSTSSLRNSGNSQATSSLRGSGNSSVSVSVSLPSTLASANTSSNGSSASPVANQATGPGSSAYNTASQDNVSYSGTQTIKTNPSIQAPGLTTTLSDTCMGSVSFGFSAPGFGATAGSTLVDQACVRRLDAREFRAMGLTDVALALLCQSDANRRAVEATGHLCPGTTAPLAKATGEVSPLASVSDDLKYRDPIVRERLGLPALDRSAAVQAQEQAQAAAQPVAQPAAQPVAQTASTDSAQAAIATHDATQAAVSPDTNNVQSIPVESVVAKVSALK